MAASDSAAVLAHHGRSFHWASAFLTKQHAQDAATLYAFCRHADDLVDELPPVEGRAEIVALRARLAGGDESGPSVAVDVVSAFAALMQRCRIDPVVVDVLLDTLQRDTGAVRFRDRRQLVRYAFGVASTVGLMMCDVLGCSDRRGRAFAIDLGIAMQLTNISRDVLEDAGRGRIYVPMAKHISSESLRHDSVGVRSDARSAVADVLDLAALYYRSADHGMRYLPWRARAAILAASRIYEGIGAVIRRRGPDYWQRRCHVNAGGKLWHTARALSALVIYPRFWPSGPTASHDPRLHADLHGLPEIDPA
ncbi:MAG: phytoene synthase [Planctomycetota bacterium]|jgi:phytoene synthase